MRVTTCAFAGLLIFLCAGATWADAPKLVDGVYIQDGAGDLKVSMYASPTSVDWNNDGAKDLIVGQYVSGNILYFENQGTDLNPVFSGSVMIQSSGSPISVTYG